MKRSFLFVTFGLGFLLTGVGFSMLNSGGQGIRPDRNPFAIQQSGYGKTLARLSQDTIDVVWHLGVEGVNPVGHVHDENCNHGHDEIEAQAPVEDPAVVNLVWNGLNEEELSLLAEAGIERDGIHCSECLVTATASLKKGETVSSHDLPAIHAFHQMSDEEDAHEGHDHAIAQAEDEHAGHDHGAEVQASSQKDFVTGAMEWLRDLGHAQYARTSRFSISEVHKKAVAADIEKMLLRGYKMDPTDYGVYNGYFLFLTIHELRGTPEARDHARLISRLTVTEAMKEDVDPQPWLTAAIATLNLFFLEQEDYRNREEELPVKLLTDFRDQMRYCLHQFAVTRQKAVAEGRWEMISEIRRQDMLERERFASIATEQFGAMLARVNSREDEVENGGAKVGSSETGDSVSRPVATNGEPEGAEKEE